MKTKKKIYRKNIRVTKAFKDSFEVKGGGRNGIVQGTVKADKNDIIDF